MFKKITRKKLDLFLKKYSTTDKVLDIGSGGSLYDKFFPNRLTVDIDPARKPEIVADAESLPFEDGYFSFVLCTEVLEHVKNPQKVIDEIYRVLIPGGRVVLTTRFVYPIHDAPHDYWRFTKYGLKLLFEKFTIIELVGEAKSFTTIAILIQRICFQSQLFLNKFSKVSLFVIAYLLSHLDWIVKKEFDSIHKGHDEENIMTSGYYIVARK